MKIEKIRFKNLASLAGEWEIDLTGTLFADAGIFALSGPVGSGKSTVFDAVRLALYGRTARLDRVNQNDNEIMTRGETECFAEVVFSNDSGRFLCRWSQHRAVRTGKLQKAQHLLSELGTGDGEGRILSSKLEETRDRIRSLTGMDFSHFSRAMILPQGQFADFLRASPDERSPLLEQITGTGIYAEISRKVHELTRARNLEREALEQSCAGIEILSDERLQELQNAIRTFRQSVQTISSRYDAASEILRTRNALQQESATLSTLETTLAGEKRELSRCEQRRAEAEQAKLHAESERTILVPRLRRVRELDTRLSLLEENRKNLRREFEEQEAVYKKWTVDTQKKESRLQQGKHRLQTIADELKRRAADSRLSARLPAIELLCGELTAIRREIEHGEAELQSLEREFSLGGKQLDELRTRYESQLRTTRDREELLRNKETFLSSLLDGKTIPEFFAEKERLAQTLLSLDQQLRRHSEAAALRTKIQESETLQHRIRQELDSVHALLRMKTDLKAAREQQIALLEQQALEHARIAHLEELRKSLEENRPCPLCGSLEHPYVHHLPENRSGELPERKRALRQTEAEIADLQTALSRHQLHLETEEAKVLQLRTELDAAAASLTGTPDELEKAHRDAENAMARQTTIGAMIERAGNDRDQARKALEDARNILQTLSGEQEAAIRRQAERQSHRELLERMRTEKTERESQLRRTLSDHLSDLGLQDDADPATLPALLRERCTLYETLAAEQKDLDAEQLLLTAEIRTAQERSATLAAEQNTRKARLDEQTAAWNALDAERRGLFGDKQPDEEEKKAALLLKEAENALHAADTQLQDFRLKSESLQTSIRESEERIRRAREFLESHGSDPSADPETIRTELRELDSRRQALLSSIGEKTLLLDQHAANQARFTTLTKQIAEQRELCRKWEMLDDLIGSADGKKYRLFVQSLTFETLIALANEQLQKFTDHFSLTGTPGGGLEFNIRDHYRGDEIRSTRNLSGGETFLVSLSLALALSRMARNKVRIDTLFLDEGFGTLDEETLQHALEQLSSLRQEGKLIGIISHAHGIDTAVPVVLHLENNCGRSTICGPGVTFRGE